MKMDVFPFLAHFLPDPRLLARRSGWTSITGTTLNQPCVGNHSDVTHYANMRIANRGVACSSRWPKVKIETVKRHPVNQPAKRLRFKCGERFITKFDVGFPITTPDAIQKLLR